MKHYVQSTQFGYGVLTTSEERQDLLEVTAAEREKLLSGELRFDGVGLVAGVPYEVKL